MDPSTTDKKALDALKNTGAPGDLITLSNGVVLRGVMVPPLVYVTVVGAFPMPKPPEWKNPLLGRMVENPDDPDYIKRVESVENEKNSAILNVMIVYGTKTESVPDFVSKPFVEYKKVGKKDEKVYPAWFKRYKNLGLPTFEDDEDWMYLTWVKTFATKEDLELIQKVVGRLSGVPEKDVQAAEEFPGRN